MEIPGILNLKRFEEHLILSLENKQITAIQCRFRFDTIKKKKRICFNKNKPFVFVSFMENENNNSTLDLSAVE